MCPIAVRDAAVLPDERRSFAQYSDGVSRPLSAADPQLIAGVQTTHHCCTLPTRRRRLHVLATPHASHTHTHTNNAVNGIDFREAVFQGGSSEGEVLSRNVESGVGVQVLAQSRRSLPFEGNSDSGYVGLLRDCTLNLLC